MPLRLRPTFGDDLRRADRPLGSMWVGSGSPLIAEICAGAGLDWLLVDMEHSPNGLEAVLAQLQAVAAYPVTPVVRVPIGDGVLNRSRTGRSTFVQVETLDGVDNAAAIAAVDGVDGVFVGPSDLAASMGLLGQQTHPGVTAAAMRALEAVRSKGTPAGVNAFDPAVAQSYLDAGASFLLVGADVAILARNSEALASRWVPAAETTDRASY